jgi:hypothetical protein
MADFEKLVALHKHWVAADSINYHLRRSVDVAKKASNDVPKAFGDVGRVMSVFAALSVWYALLYVVVEGYRELAFQDEDIDKLLANDEYLQALRLFRNATFHYQESPLSPKLMTFLEAKDSEIWIMALNRALKGFFERELKITNLGAFGKIS